jgi:hypothetical protein
MYMKLGGGDCDSGWRFVRFSSFPFSSFPFSSSSACSDLDVVTFWGILGVELTWT